MDTLETLNLPALAEAIVVGNLEDVNTLLQGDVSPNTSLIYQAVQNGAVQEVNTTPLALAVANSNLAMVQLLIESGAVLNPDDDTLLYQALKRKQLAIFAYLVAQGAKIADTQRTVSRFFLNLMYDANVSFLPVVVEMGLSLQQYGGETLRSAASDNLLEYVQFMLAQGVDINFHKPDMIYPYASTPVIEAARADHVEMVQYLIEQGADITIADKYGDRPYTLAIKNKNAALAAYLKALEPEAWHSEQEKARQLKPYKLPASLVKYLQTGPLRIEFSEDQDVRFIQLYSYMDTLEIKWQRKKLLSLMAEMDQYSDYMLVWNPKEKNLWFIDEEHEEFYPLCTWEAFIAAPGKYINGMVEGEFNA